MKKILFTGLMAIFCLTSGMEAKSHKKYDKEYTDSLIEKLDQSQTTESFKAILKDAMRKKQINKHNCATVLAMVAITCLFEWSSDMLNELEDYLEKNNLVKYLED